MLYKHCDHQLVTTEGEYDVRALSTMSPGVVETHLAAHNPAR